MNVPNVDLHAQYESIEPEVLAAIRGVLQRMDLWEGADTRAFETELAAFVGAQHAVAVSSGRDGLYLALRACGIGPGDEVITAAVGSAGVTEAAQRLQATPVYVDIDETDYTLNPSLIADAVTRQTRAIAPVDLYGQLADLDAINAIATKHGLTVIEDARDACGATQGLVLPHRFEHAAVFSFSPWRNLGAYGAIGAVATNSRAIAHAVRALSGEALSDEFADHLAGVDALPDEIQAGILRVKLPHLAEWNARRQAHARAYDRLLAEGDVIVPQPHAHRGHVYQHYVVRVRQRERVAAALHDLGVETRVRASVRHDRQRSLWAMGRVSGPLPVAEALLDGALHLPMYPELTEQYIEYTSSALLTAVALA